MRISEERRIQNRDTIVEAAANLFRKRGFDGVGVADIMKEAGFTHGGFYNHFNSKDELIAAAIQRAFINLDKEMRGRDFASIIGRYLSLEHQNDSTHGCPASSLGGDTARQSTLAKDAFADGIEKWISMLSEALSHEKNFPELKSRKAMLGLYARIAGGVMLARSCPPDGKLRDEILEACTISKPVSQRTRKKKLRPPR